MRPASLRSLRPRRISFFAFQDIITSVTGVLILVTLILSLYLNPLPAVTRAESAGPADLAAIRAEIERTQAENAELEKRLAAVAGAPPVSRLKEDLVDLDLRWQAASNRLAEVRRHRAAAVEEAAQQRAGLGLEALGERTSRIKVEAADQARTNEATVRAVEALEGELRKLQAHSRETDSNAARLFLLPDESGAVRRPLLVVVSSQGMRCERYGQPERREDVPASAAESRWREILRTADPGEEQVLFYVRPSGIELFRRCSELARSGGYRLGYEALEENRPIDFAPMPGAAQPDP